MKPGRPPNPTPAQEPRLEAEPPDGRIPPLENEGHVHDVCASGQRLDGASATLSEWRSVALRDCSLSSAQLPRWEVRDARLVRCDLAGADLLRASWDRVALNGCRLTGASFPEARLADVTFVDCRADLVSLRYATLERVRFTGCQLDQLDLRGARLSDVLFEDCLLTALDVTETRARRTHFRGGTLERIAGIAGLRGATLGHTEAIGILPELAGALGVKIADD